MKALCHTLKSKLQTIAALSKTTRLLLTFAGLLFILSFYILLRARSYTPAYAEPDPDGYVFLARSFAAAHMPRITDHLPVQYHPHVWVETADGSLVPKFSPGFPILMALSIRVFGDSGIFLINPIMGGLALIGLFFLTRSWAGSVAAIAATLTMSVNWYFFTTLVLC